MTPDLQYKNYGLFTSFYPITEQGRVAWAELAEKTGGTCKVPFHHEKSTIEQLRAAGYIVHKSR